MAVRRAAVMTNSGIRSGLSKSKCVSGGCVEHAVEAGSRVLAKLRTISRRPLPESFFPTECYLCIMKCRRLDSDTRRSDSDSSLDMMQLPLWNEKRYAP